MRITFVLAAAVFLSLPSPARSEALKIEPGQWEFTSTMTAAMGGAPSTTTSTECIRDGEMTPEKFNAKMQGCQISDAKTDGSSMSWKLSCPTAAGQMTGSGRFTSTDTTVAGSIDMTMDVGGQKFPMSSAWKGKRKGDCQ